MTWRRRFGFLLIAIALLGLGLWLARARLAAELARAYFRSHGIASSVEIGALGLSGISGRVTLGTAPEFSAEAIELRFDPLSWTPRVVEVRLVKPLVRARMDAHGAVTLPSLQPWLDSLSSSAGGQSRFVSDDLVIVFSGLRVLLAMPGGTLELTGEGRMAHGAVVSALLRARPADITFQGQQLRVQGATLRLQTLPSGMTVTADFSGAIQSPSLKAEGVAARLTGAGLRWASTPRGLVFSAPDLRLHLSAASWQGAGLSLADAAADLTARQVSGSLVDGMLEGSADLDLKAKARAPTLATVIRTQLPILAKDRALAVALASNLQYFDLALAARAEHRQGKLRFALTAPLVLTGAKGGALRLASLTLQGPVTALQGTADASLSGGGLPSLALTTRRFTWQDGALAADAALRARFDFDMLRGVQLAASGAASWKEGVFTFGLSQCARASLTALRPGGKVMASAIAGTICAVPGQALMVANSDGWRLAAAGRGLSAFLPLANAQIKDGAGRLSFAAEGNGDPRGTITVTGMEVNDRAAPLRFHPLSASGDIQLDHWIWNGRMAMADAHKAVLGDVTFTHATTSGVGRAHVAAPRLSFAPGGLQPEHLSPLLAPFRQAEGKVGFTGDIAWTAAEITSHGKIAVESFDFLTPFGTAHAVKADIALKSLLPPVTEDNQGLAIARIDWTVPFSGVDLNFSFSPDMVRINAVKTNFAEGHAALGAFVVDLKSPRLVNGAADLEGISLAPLVAVSNLGDKVKLEGKLSGHVPFSFGPEGFRITKGHLQSDGPGRLAIDRALWAQGGNGISSVQDFAYQALENLAFDQLTADINSVANGRLQILFHIKGRSDPPKPQYADIPIADLVNGTALQKAIPLPSGTPIDLTLDTSLNFDELLKSYGEAWSNSLKPAGQPAQGAIP